jgi:hypothetical protein
MPGGALAILKKHEQGLQGSLIGGPHQSIGGQQCTMSPVELFAADVGQLFEQHGDIIRVPSRAGNEISSKVAAAARPALKPRGHYSLAYADARFPRNRGANVCFTKAS